jgi:hypothetical protein
MVVYTCSMDYRLDSLYPSLLSIILKFQNINTRLPSNTLGLKFLLIYTSISDTIYSIYNPRYTIVKPPNDTIHSGADILPKLADDTLCDYVSE